MQVATTSMDPRIARIHYGDYLKKCRETREKRRVLAEKERLEGSKKYREARLHLELMEKEDRQLLSAYKALKRGQTILHLGNVVVNAGLNDRKLPKLAVTRAQRTWCHLSAGNVIQMVGSADKRGYADAKKSDRFVLPFKKGFTPELNNWRWRRENKYPDASVVAAVPAVPAHLRPDDLASGAYHILWEAEWEAKPPVDPILLKQVDNSDFFVVLAQWDATPLEQQVLQGRFS